MEKINFKEGFYLFVIEKSSCCDTGMSWEETYLLRFNSVDKRNEEEENLASSQDMETQYIFKKFEVFL